MIPGIAPVIIRKLPPAPSGYSFTMTAGETELAPGFLYRGFSDGSPEAFLPAFGSILIQPSSRVITIATASWLPIGAIAVSGNMVSEFAGRTVWVDDVEYPFDGAGWVYSAEADGTAAQWETSGAPTFIKDQTYFVEVK